MREIKFRAWNKDTKKMTDAEELWKWLQTENNIGIAGGTLGMAQTDIDENEYKHLDFMQFTGLTDKNGKEIYEGDIVKIIDDDEEHIKAVEYQVFQEDMVIGWNPFGNDFFCTSDSYEVIGNIYENPELLKETP